MKKTSKGKKCEQGSGEDVDESQGDANANANSDASANSTNGEVLAVINMQSNTVDKRFDELNCTLSTALSQALSRLYLMSANECLQPRLPPNHMRN